MPPKCSAPSKASGSEPKRQRNMLTIKEKVELLNMLKEGKSYVAVGHHYGINESNVHYIKKDKKNIRSTATMTFHKTAKRVVTSCNKAIVRMESSLALWVNDCRKKNISLDTNTIQMKAKKFYDSFSESTDVRNSDKDEDKDDDAETGRYRSRTVSASPTRPTPFSASKGWFDKFQGHFGLRSVSLHGEAASADKKQHQQLPITMFIAQRKRSVTPTPLAEIEGMAQGKDTAPPDEAPDEVVPSEEL